MNKGINVWICAASTLLCFVGFGWEDLNSQGEPKRASDVWGLGETGAAMKHGIGCMCLGCQGERYRSQMESEELEKKEEQQRAAERNRQRNEWDVQLKAMGVTSWSYSSITKFKSPRVKCSIVFSDGQRINYNEKITGRRKEPTPIDIVLASRPELAVKLKTFKDQNVVRPQLQDDLQAVTKPLRRPGYCVYCNARLISNKATTCSRCKWRDQAR